MKSLVLKPSTVALVVAVFLFNLSCSKDDNPVEPDNNKKPVVTIVTPASSAAFVEGDTVSFSATVTDEEDSVINDSALVWTSDKDGQIGIGLSFQSDSLTVNTHRIILSATDSEGGVGADTVSVTINQKSSSSVGFQKTYGGDDLDEGHSVCAISDGGYIVAGKTGMIADDVYLVKTDSAGNLAWEKTFTGTSNLNEGHSVLEAVGGGYVVAGSSGGRVYLLKVNSSGDSLWAKSFGGLLQYEGYSVCAITTGGYAITGTNGQGICLIKTDNSGNLVWEKSFAGIRGRSVIETSDGGFVIAGSKSIQPDSGNFHADVYLLKTNSNGDSLWAKNYGGIEWDEGYCVVEVSGGNLVVTGEYTVSLGGSYYRSDAYLLKTDNKGDSLWARTFGSEVSYYGSDGNSVCEAPDGGYVVAGRTLTSLKDWEVYLVKTDSDGNLAWEKEIGGVEWDRGYSIDVTSDGGFIITGYSAETGEYDRDVYLIKTDADGNVN